MSRITGELHSNKNNPDWTKKSLIKKINKSLNIILRKASICFPSNYIRKRYAQLAIRFELETKLQLSVITESNPKAK